MLNTLLLFLRAITPATRTTLQGGLLEKCKRAHEVRPSCTQTQLEVLTDLAQEIVCFSAYRCENLLSEGLFRNLERGVSRSTSRGQQSTAPICSFATCSAKRLLNKVHRFRAKVLLTAQIKLHHQADLSRDATPVKAGCRTWSKCSTRLSSVTAG